MDAFNFFVNKINKITLDSATEFGSNDMDEFEHTWPIDSLEMKLHIYTVYFD